MWKSQFQREKWGGDKKYLEEVMSINCPNLMKTITQRSKKLSRPPSKINVRTPY